jgi:osmotically-inducible protein OsmY
MTKKRDSELKRKIESEIKWDANIWLSEIDVSVDNGVVTLTGSVDSYAKKVAAQEAAHRVVGVLDVANDIEVKHRTVITDADVAKAVRDALIWDALVPDHKIESTVTNGWVLLEGAVNSLRESEDAERVVKRLRGVLGVFNKIKVAPPAVNTNDLRKVIEDALERRADREAERLRIEIFNGAVDLFGRVHTWQERRAVLGSISHLPGVRQVNDHLSIDPYF